MGWVYLLHFQRPISENHTTQHYLGSTVAGLAARMQQHRNGNGVRLLEVARERGISFTVARVWIGGRELEKRLKRRKESPRLCPICSCNPKPVHYAEELTPEALEDALIPF